MACSRTMNCCIPTRYCLAFLLMGVVIHLFTLRSNFSIIVVAMVKHSANNEGNSSRENECYDVNITQDVSYSTHENITTDLLALNDKTGVLLQVNRTEHNSQDKFSWDPVTQGRIIGAYSYGNVFSQVMGGFLEARFGGKKVLGLSILLSSVLTLLTPAAAVAGEWWLFVVRVVVGFVQQTIEAWQKVFYIGAAISVSGSVMALLFLRTDPVSWAQYPDEAQDPDEDKLPQPARDKLIPDFYNGEEEGSWPELVYETTV
uniref:Major facilitator superfamily (MFS) profile domain-containing protein n=1 Tax=Branchiostoma floridae TaxID=7739 RepID=C3YFX7_BRAFL|eukprot:XP_002604772.1 hypothetical protein BRAFLDRAFT_70621 [Branchiostoma floridae]